MQWDDDKTDTLVALWRDKQTSTAIAKELGITRNAVMGKIKRLGLVGKGPSRKPPPGRNWKMRSEPLPNVSRETSPFDFRKRSDGQLPARPRELPLPSDAAQRSFNEAGGRSLMELEHGQCHWPIGDPIHDRDNFCYCAAPVWGKSSYCAQHQRIMWAKR